jgi:hypothetical protein
MIYKTSSGAPITLYFVLNEYEIRKLWGLKIGGVQRKKRGKSCFL